MILLVKHNKNKNVKVIPRNTYTESWRELGKVLIKVSHPQWIKLLHMLFDLFYILTKDLNISFNFNDSSVIISHEWTKT